MKRKVFMTLAIGAGCCLITGNVLMAQPSVPQWEYVEQTDDGMLVFRMGEIEAEGSLKTGRILMYAKRKMEVKLFYLKKF